MERFIVLIAKFNEQLWGREEGREVREAIVSEFLAQSKPVLLLDFTNVSRIDFSCASEIVSILLLRLSTELKGRHLLLTGLTRLVQENIEAALEKVEKCCIVLTANGWDLIGKYSEALKETLSKVIELQEADTPKISNSLGIAVTSCNNRLKTLVDLGMVMRKEVPSVSGGKQFMYYSLLT